MTKQMMYRDEASYFRKAFDLPAPSIHCESGGCGSKAFLMKCGDQKIAKRLRRLQDVNSSRADIPMPFCAGAYRAEHI